MRNAAFITISAFLMLGQRAEAAQIVSEYDLYTPGITFGSVIRPFEIAGFDNSLGTLTAVTLALTGQVISTVAPVNGEPFPVTYETLTYGLDQFSFAGVDLLAQNGEGANLPVPPNTYQGQYIPIAVTVAGEITSNDALALATFSQAGPVAGWHREETGFSCSNCQDPFTIGFAGLAYTRQLRVTYDYEPSLAGAVPEPATWAMLILGFGLTGAAMRSNATRRLSAPALSS